MGAQLGFDVTVLEILAAGSIEDPGALAARRLKSKFEPEVRERLVMETYEGSLIKTGIGIDILVYTANRQFRYRPVGKKRARQPTPDSQSALRASSLIVLDQERTVE